MKSIIKKITGAAIAGAALISLAGCNDYLDVTQEQTLPGDSVDYNDLSNMYGPVSACYASVRSSMMHWVINLLTVIRDGDVWSGRVDDQGDLVNIGNHYVYNNSTFWGIGEAWTQFSQVVLHCNEALVNLDNYYENCTTDNLRKQCLAYQGEVRIIRALAYYRLVQFFGAVPIRFTNDVDDYNRYSREAVYEYILQDLQFAMDNTPKLRPNQMEHVGAYSAYTAEMLAAKVYLNLAGFTGNDAYYANVQTLTQDIIDNGGFSLYPDYYNLWKLQGRLCNESLMECQVTDFGLGEGDYIGVDQFFNCAGPGITTTTDETDPSRRYIGGWYFVVYFDSLYNWAIARGETIRATTSFLLGDTWTPSGDYVYANGNPQNTSNWNGKWYLPINEILVGRTDYGTGNNVRMLRYAEVLLMNAEAKVRRGQNGDVPFNEVRARANMPSITGVTVTDILDERRMELCCEWGERYADLIRTGLAESVLGPDGWTKEKTYFPVPPTQIDLAPALRNEPYTSLNQ